MTEDAQPNTNVEQEQLLSVTAGDTSDIPIEWKDVGSVLVDSVVGYVIVADLPRITLGQITYRPGGRGPSYVPQVTITATIPALKFMAAQLMEIAVAAEKDDEAGNDAAAV